MSLARYNVERRSTKSSIFYNHINTLIDWSKVEKEISRHYTKADKLKGRPAYHGL